MSERTVVWYPAGVDPLAPDGSEVVLEGDPDSPFRELAGSSGGFVAPWAITTQDSPGFDGTTLVAVRKLARDPSYRFECRASDPGQFANAMQDLASALTSSRDPGTLVVGDRLGTDAGAIRSMRCLYVGGLEGDSMLGRNRRWWAFDLKFKAFDPCWYSLEPTVASWTGRVGVPYIPFKLPLVLAPLGVSATVPLVLDGDTESWGDWSLAGPWSRFKVTNDRSGAWWEIRRSNESALEDLTVDTARYRVRNLAGVNRYGFTGGSQLFPLAPGDTLSVDADSANDLTHFDLSVYPAWLTAP